MSENMNLAGTRVLVIDDSNVVHHCARVLLTAAGCEVFVSKTGFDALSQLADCNPDVVLLDAIMPRLEGHKTCTLIKSNAKYAHIPVVMLSAKESLVDCMRGRMAGADHYLTKPFSRKTLLPVVAANRRNTRRSGAPMLEFNVATG